MTPAARFRRPVVLAIAVVCWGAALHAGEAEAPHPSEPADDLATIVESVAHRVESIRGSKLASTPEAARVPAGPTPARSSAESAQLAARGRAWSDLGFGDATAPAELATILQGDLDGIALDPETGIIRIVGDHLSPKDFGPELSGGDSTSLLLVTGVRPDEPAMAHALTHAMQRRLQRWPPADPTTDGRLAAAAWAEGEANLVALLFLMQGIGLEGEVLSGRFNPVEAYGGRLYPSAAGTTTAPIAALVRFVFEEGFYQSAEIVRKSGWPSLVPFARARSTTRDVLHADRQPGAAPVALPADFDPPRGLRLVDTDRLGEQAIVTLISSLTGKDNLALMAGDGWMGDAVYRWEPENAAEPGTRGVTLWRTAWTDAKETEEFRYSLERGLTARFPGGTWTKPDRQSQKLDAGASVFLLRATEREVSLRACDAATGRELENSIRGKTPAARTRPKKN